MSHITVTGNVTADPELRYTQNGRPVTQFTLIENRRTRKGDGWVDAEPNAFRVEAWNDLAENIAASVQKGARLSVEGRIVTNRWNDKSTGEARTAQHIVADEVAYSLRFHTVTATKKKAGDNAPDAAANEPWETAPIPDGDTPF